MEEKIIVNTDGGARGNPGPAASAFVVRKGDEVIFKKGFYLDETTNNIAEYTAVLKALEWLKENNFIDKEIFFEIDSELVVRQLTGIYKVKNFQLKVLYQKIKNLEKSFSKGIFYRHIFREKNFLADKIVNEKIDEYKSVSRLS